MFSRNQTISNTNELLNILLALILPTSHNEWEFTKSRFLEAKLCLHPLAHWAPMPKCAPCTPAFWSVRASCSFATWTRGGQFLRAVQSKGTAEAGSASPLPSWPFLFLEGNSGCWKEEYTEMKTDQVVNSLPGQSVGMSLFTFSLQVWLGCFPMLMSSPCLVRVWGHPRDGPLGDYSKERN